MNGYLIDSNILINSNRYYRQQFFPVVWQFYLQTPDLYMLDRVYAELVSKDDSLGKWTKANYKPKLISADESFSEYREVNHYLSQSKLWTPAGYQEWTDKMEKADPWLIVCAMKNSYTIVTDEKNTGPNGRASDNEPKIPFVSEHFKVPTVSFWEFLKQKQFLAQ